MLHIKILGPSCGKCLRLETMVMEALEELGLAKAEVEKVTEETVIDKHLTEEPPGLLINDRLNWAGGELPQQEQVRNWLEEIVPSIQQGE